MLSLSPSEVGELLVPCARSFFKGGLDVASVGGACLVRKTTTDDDKGQKTTATTDDDNDGQQTASPKDSDCSLASVVVRCHRPSSLSCVIVVHRRHRSSSVGVVGVNFLAKPFNVEETHINNSMSNSRSCKPTDFEKRPSGTQRQIES